MSSVFDQERGQDGTLPTKTNVTVTVNAIIYWQESHTNNQPPSILKHWHFIMYLTYELRVLHTEEHILLYQHNCILKHKDHFQTIHAYRIWYHTTLVTITKEQCVELNFRLSWAHTDWCNGIEFNHVCWQYSGTCIATISLLDDKGSPLLSQSL